MSLKRLTIVTVTYNSASVITQLLAPLQGVDADILVVDNGSRDDTVRLASVMPNVRVIPSGNVGYGRGANVGFREAKTPYILLVNPDVVITPDTINQMVACMDAEPNIGILGANMTDKPASGLVDVEWIVGALMLIRNEALSKAGLFDENIFLFYEETDLCQRFRKAGYRLAVLQSVMAKHEAGTSSLPSIRVLKIKAWHSAWSKAYYYRKHFSRATYMRKCATKILYAVCRMIRGCYRFKREQIIKNVYELRGMTAFLCGIGAFKNGVGRLT